MGIFHSLSSWGASVSVTLLLVQQNKLLGSGFLVKGFDFWWGLGISVLLLGIYYYFTFFIMVTVNCFNCKLLLVGLLVVSEVFWDVGI